MMRDLSQNVPSVRTRLSMNGVNTGGTALCIWTEREGGPFGGNQPPETRASAEFEKNVGAHERNLSKPTGAEFPAGLGDSIAL